MNFKKFISLLAAAVLVAAAFAGCGSSDNSSSESSSNVIASDDGVKVELIPDGSGSSSSEETSSDGEAMNVAMLKGPTAIGAVMLMKAQDEGTAEGNYNFTIDTAPDSVVSKVISGEVDVAAVPSNSAAAIYNKTEGGVVVAAVNTLGTLYLLENGNTINSVADLAGKTINSSGQGAVPEYVLNYILSKSGTEGTTINFMQAHDELAAAIASGEVDNALLPEPYADVALAKNPDLRVALDIAQCYDEYSGVDKGEMPNTLPMGCIIIRKEYAESHPEEVKLFLEEYKKSIEEVNSNVEESAKYVVSYGVIDDETVAKEAIPKCNIYYIDGDEMKNVMGSFLNVMNEANPQSIGGKVPGDDFYYAG